VIPLRRTTLLAGIVFGVTIVVVDTAMLAMIRDAGRESREAALTFCFNFLVSNIFYTLSGYIAGASALNRRQGLAAGLLAAIIAGVLGGITSIFITPETETAGRIVVDLLSHLLFNVTMGAAFGFVGGNIGTRPQQ
jgi:hypothetical protein